MVIRNVTSGSRYGTTDRNADAVKLALTIGADEGIVADGKQVDQVEQSRCDLRNNA